MPIDEGVFNEEVERVEWKGFLNLFMLMTEWTALILSFEKRID